MNTSDFLARTMPTYIIIPQNYALLANKKKNISKIVYIMLLGKMRSRIVTN